MLNERPHTLAIWLPLPPLLWDHTARLLTHTAHGFFVVCVGCWRCCPPQANVKEPRFGLDYIKTFDIVLNGLDNMDARRHVNRWGETPVQTHLQGLRLHLRLCMFFRPPAPAPAPAWHLHWLPAYMTAILSLQ